MHSILSILLSTCLLFSPLLTASESEIPQTDTTQTETSQADTTQEVTEELAVSAPSVVLMESSTGQIIYEKDPHAVLRPASITKIMTLTLIFDALASGKISLEDTVTVSEYAASMGGSQVFLEAGETQTVDTMIKCISVASANDACASYI